MIVTDWTMCSEGAVRLVCRCDHYIPEYITAPLNQEFRGDDTTCYSGIQVSRSEQSLRVLFVTSWPDSINRVMEVLDRIQELDEPQRHSKSAYEVTVDLRERTFEIVHQFNASRPMPWEES